MGELTSKRNLWTPVAHSPILVGQSLTHAGSTEDPGRLAPYSICLTGEQVIIRSPSAEASSTNCARFKGIWRRTVIPRRRVCGRSRREQVFRFITRVHNQPGAGYKAGGHSPNSSLPLRHDHHADSKAKSHSIPPRRLRHRRHAAPNFPHQIQGREIWRVLSDTPTPKIQRELRVATCRQYRSIATSRYSLSARSTIA